MDLPRQRPASSVASSLSMTETTRTFSQFLSATMGPPVARVSAPRQIPSSSPESPPPYLRPTMVVPVEVAKGGC